MRGITLILISMAIGAVTGLFLVATGQFLGAFMGAASGLIIALIILAFPRERDYPREQDDTFL